MKFRIIRQDKMEPAPLADHDSRECLCRARRHQITPGRSEFFLCLQPGAGIGAIKTNNCAGCT